MSQKGHYDVAVRLRGLLRRRLPPTKSLVVTRKSRDVRVVITPVSGNAISLIATFDWSRTSYKDNAFIKAFADAFVSRL